MKQNDFYEVDGCTVFIPVKIIEEHKHMTNTLEVELTETGYRTVVPKVNEPQKPVVPKFVAEWIEEIKETTDDLSWIWSVYPAEHKTKKWLEQNTEKFMRAWLDGFEVEKEKLYTVEIPNPNGSGYSKIYLAKNKDGEVEFFTWSGYTSIEFADDWKQEENAQLTESEIKKDFEWAWQWAEPVEDN